MLNKQRLIRISINFIIFVVLFSVSNALAIHHKIPVGGKVSSSYSFSPYWTDFVEYWRQSEIWGKPSFIHYTTKKVVKEETVLPGDTLTIYYVIEATPNAKVGTYEFEVTYEFSKSKYGPSLYEKTLSFEIKIVPGTEPSPVAKFSGSPTNGPCPLSVYFTDESTGTIDSWYWDFGDGETSTEQNPTHTYNSTGYFTVSLTVTGPGGSDTETKEDYIHVTEVATPVADIKVNNSDDPITLYQNDTLTITVSLNNNGITNNADWWLAADTPFGLFFFTFDGWTDAWVPGYQSPLFYLDSFEVLNMPVSGLPAGTYTLYFGVDTVMDRNVTWDSVYYDTVEVNVIGYSYLLEKYAPVLKFSSGEGYYPTIVENMIDNSCIQIKENSTCLDLFCDEKGTDWDDEQLMSLKSTIIENLDFAVYGRILEKDGRIYLQYWFFYIYNDWKRDIQGVNNHEGDWEMIVVELNQDQTPLRVGYSQHRKIIPEIPLIRGGEVGNWEDLVGSQNIEDETHPVIYVARGSHASYPESGELSFEISGVEFVEVYHGDGLILRPSYYQLLNIEKGYHWSWIREDYRWGMHNDSPPSPVAQGDKWSDPGAWMDSLQ